MIKKKFAFLQRKPKKKETMENSLLKQIYKKYAIEYIGYLNDNDSDKCRRISIIRDLMFIASEIDMLSSILSEEEILKKIEEIEERLLYDII